MIGNQYHTIKPPLWWVCIILRHHCDLLGGLVAHPIPPVRSVPAEVSHLSVDLWSDSIHSYDILEIDICFGIANRKWNIFRVITQRTPDTSCTKPVRILK